MLVKLFGSAVYGVEAVTITVEVNVTEGLHTYVVGLADSVVKESIQRIESAIKSNGYFMPRTKLVINLAPAGIRKTGSAFDLPIALGVLAASGQLPADTLEGLCHHGRIGVGWPDPFHQRCAADRDPVPKRTVQGVTRPAIEWLGGCHRQPAGGVFVWSSPGGDRIFPGAIEVSTGDRGRQSCLSFRRTPFRSRFQ